MADEPLGAGERAPGFTLPATDGKDYSLADYRGRKAIAVVFSCNHCPYVRAWEDRMIQIQRDYADRDVVLLAINSNDEANYPEDSFEKMIQRARDKGYSFPYLRDKDQSVAHAFGAEVTPHVFLLDGDLVCRYKGAIDDNHANPSAVKQPYLRQAIDALLAGKTPTVQETRPMGCSVKWCRI